MFATLSESLRNKLVKQCFWENNSNNLNIVLKLSRNDQKYAYDALCYSEMGFMIWICNANSVFRKLDLVAELKNRTVFRFAKYIYISIFILWFDEFLRAKQRKQLKRLSMKNIKMRKKNHKYEIINYIFLLQFFCWIFFTMYLHIKHDFVAIIWTNEYLACNQIKKKKQYYFRNPVKKWKFHKLMKKQFNLYKYNNKSSNKTQN